jgi:hypothetical protein
VIELTSKLASDFPRPLSARFISKVRPIMHAHASTDGVVAALFFSNQAPSAASTQLAPLRVALRAGSFDLVALILPGGTVASVTQQDVRVDATLWRPSGAVLSMRIGASVSLDWSAPAGGVSFGSDHNKFVWLPRLPASKQQFWSPAWRFCSSLQGARAWLESRMPGGANRTQVWLLEPTTARFSLARTLLSG